MNRDFNADVDFDWDEGPPMDNFGPPPGMGPRPPFRNDRYSNAYGNYRGGYGPPGGFGGPGIFGGRPGPYFDPANFFPTPRGPGFMRERGFGPVGPPAPRFTLKERVIEYLTRCGVPKENLRNMPRELVRIIKPEFCGVCSMNFNSFSSSRVHYTSKNHLKNQRKFLSQRLENGPSKEIPLRSRELYCELCDVQITSKTHADSHYAGKPHRAIVEGRKQPKNPALLSRRMQDRLELLIRREKKHLKPEEKTETSTKDTKPVDPDLYCDICKTSVTCSDQMTMHMNGKKHLSKEKRHILAMMKGETEGKTENDNDGNNEEDEANDEEDEGNANAAEGNSEDETTFAADQY